MKNWFLALGLFLLLLPLIIVGGKGGPATGRSAINNAAEAPTGAPSSSTNISGETPAQYTPAFSPTWSSTGSLSAEQNASLHWQKHGAEFPEFQSAAQYIEGARLFFQNPPAGTLTKSRPNGDRLFYHPKTNTFGVQASNGVPRTLFRPDSGMKYWNRQ